jgi:hypothetical protein
MDEETKQRLRERFEQILAAQDRRAESIDDIERIALALGSQVKQATVEEVGQEAQKSQNPEQEGSSNQEPRIATKLACPHCHKNAWFKAIREITIQTLAGPLTMRRAYYHCKRCKSGFCPQDATLKILPGRSCTQALAQEVAALSAGLPYEMAMTILQRLTSVRLSGRSAQRLCTGSVAQIVEDFVAHRQEQMLPLAYVAKEQIPAQLPQPYRLYIEADGIHTPMEDGSWREMKVGVVRAEFADGREQMASRYISHLGDAATFGKHWEALALSCGSLKAHCLGVLGDGASWIWNLASQCFPKAVQILDFYHASEYVAAVARAVFGEQESALKSWLGLRLSELKQSRWSDFWSALDDLNQPGLESLISLRTYFSNHASRMEYASYLKRGLCIGSGLAESSCKRIVTQRLKGSGMHWSVGGAQVIARLRGFLLGSEWDEFIAFWNLQSAQVERVATSPL